MEKENRFIAVITYVTFFGWVLAIILHNNDKEKLPLNAFHIRQSLGVHIIWFIGTLLLSVIIGELLYFGCLILVIIGIINASKGELKLLPIIGKYADEYFKAIQ